MYHFFFFYLVHIPAPMMEPAGSCNVHIYLFIKLYSIISQKTVILRYDHYEQCTFIVFLMEIAC